MQLVKYILKKVRWGGIKTNANHLDSNYLI